MNKLAKFVAHFSWAVEGGGFESQSQSEAVEYVFQKREQKNKKGKPNSGIERKKDEKKQKNEGNKRERKNRKRKIFRLAEF